VILASVPLITGLLALAAWVLWKLTLGTTRPRATVAPERGAQERDTHRLGERALALADAPCECHSSGSIEEVGPALAERTRYLARHIPGAKYVELPGTDHFFFTGNP